MRFRSIVFFLIVLFVQFKSSSQGNIPLGTWRTHSSYLSSATVAISPDRIYSGSKDGFFYVDKEFNSVSKQTKIDGFSDISVKKIVYSAQTKTTIIAYINGNIDLIVDGKITKIPTIRNANEGLDKTIHHIMVHANTAFISTGLGVIVLDLLRKEVKEAYQNIGANGESVKVYYSAFFNDNLYLATSLGLMYGKLSATVNLQDFNNWRTFKAETNLPLEPVQVVTAYNNNLYAAVNGKGIYKLEADKWVLTNFPVPEKVRSMNSFEGKLFICQDSKIVTIEGSTISDLSNPIIKTPMEVQPDSELNLWIADSTSGLLKYFSKGFEPYIPNGPFSSVSNKVVYAEGKVIALPGGYNSEGIAMENQQGYSEFSKGKWKNVGPDLLADVITPPLSDFTSAAFDRENQSWYFGSFQQGLVKQSQDNRFTIYNHQNSPLTTSQTYPEDVPVSDLTVDWEGKLWVVNYGVSATSAPLHTKATDDSWNSYRINHPHAGSLVQILIDLSGQKWLRVNPKIENGGILVFNEESQKFVHLNKQSGQGGLFNAQINDFTLDKNGYIWLATNNGVSVFYNPFDITNVTEDASRPIFENQYLLKDTKTTAIAVDGGDRKWIGTETGGIWLFNDDVSELIYHFTEDNSPLPSNNILDFTIHEETGEVFISTSKGMISFRSDASENGEGVFSKVKVFPNPVLPNFKGTVGISGLIDKTDVKITDSSGKLIYKTRSSGGTASWNLASTKIRSGVYFVFSVSENGEEALVSKVAVIE